MDNGAPYGRRKAKAIAIGQAIDAQRRAVLARAMMVIGAVAVVAEGLAIAHRVMAMSHP